MQDSSGSSNGLAYCYVCHDIHMADCTWIENSLRYITCIAELAKFDKKEKRSSEAKGKK